MFANITLVSFSRYFFIIFCFQTTCMFYPFAGECPMKPVPYLEIKFVDKTVNEYFEVYNVTMTNLQTLVWNIVHLDLHLDS